MEYDAKTAAQFLRGKWQAQGTTLKTARDFIDQIATKSSTTGQAYTIKLPDARIVKSGEYLHSELKKLESSP